VKTAHGPEHKNKIWPALDKQVASVEHTENSQQQKKVELKE
jgi:hypothetical protein